MPDPVKISELPAISSVQPNDIIPVVDAALTQTSKATAAQIAAVGGGPPGDGTVTTAKIAAGAVTYPKIQAVTGDRVLGKTSGASGTVEEIPCTSFARTLLAAADGNAARALINDTPTFTGTVTVNGNIALNGQARATAGTASSPAYSFSGDTNCGIAQLGGPDTISCVTGGVERFRVNSDGNLLHVAQPAGNTLYPAYMARLWLNFSAIGGAIAIAGSGNVSSIARVGVGDYVVYFAQPMPDSAYVVHHSGPPTVVVNGSVTVHATMGVTALTTSSFRIGLFDPYNSAVRADTVLTLVSAVR